MATSPTGIGQGAPQSGAPSPSPQGGATPAIKLAMFDQLISGLAQQFPQAQQGIKMMRDGLRMVQSSASAQSAPPSQAAPPR